MNPLARLPANRTLGRSPVNGLGGGFSALSLPSAGSTEASFAGRGIAGLDLLQAETTGSHTTTIAILDGPVDRSHPCFEGASLKVVEAAGGEADGGAASRHGTHVASILFGQAGTPVAGIAPASHGLLVPIFRDGDDGRIAPCPQLDLARAIHSAVDEGASIINISGGEFTEAGRATAPLAEAVRRCAERGVLIVAAAGNEGCDCLHVPAAVPSVLAVGAMDAQGEPLGLSNFGRVYREQGVLALGKDVLGATPGGGVALRTGTSYATPIVCGVAALLVDLQLRLGAAPAPHAVRDLILSSAKGCDLLPSNDCRRVLAGRLDVPGAVHQLRKEIAMEGHDADRSTSSVVPADAAGNTESVTAPNQVEPQRAESSASSEPPAGIRRRHGSDGPPTPSCHRGSEEHSTESGGATPSGEPAIAPAGEAAPTAPPLVYAVGQLGHDLPSQARRDSLVQGGCANPDDPQLLLPHLLENPTHATAVTLTLDQETTPIYVIQPTGPYARELYATLLAAYADQLEAAEAVDRVSIPGYVVGGAQLASGQEVPVLVPEARGVRAWGHPAQIEDLEGEEAASRAEEVRSFLERVHYELRNLGWSAQERAINFAATEAFHVEGIFAAAMNQKLYLDSISVELSPIARPGSECLDVKLSFFNPKRRLEEARRIYRLTIDVSDVVPVKVGAVRSWHIH